MSIFLTICLIFLNVISIDANGSVLLTQDVKNSDVEAVINLYSPDNSVEFSIDKYILLKSPSQHDYAYTFYTLKPYGYAVVLNETASLMEACYEPVEDLPINLGEKEDLFYGGPFNIFSESDLIYMNLSDEEYSAISEFEAQARHYEENKASILQSTNEVMRNFLTRGITDEGLVSRFVEKNYFDNLRILALIKLEHAQC